MALRRLVGSTALMVASATAFSPVISPSRFNELASRTGGGSTLRTSVKCLKGSKSHPEGLDKSICQTPDPATKDFIMQQTMLRIKDPRKSLDFYTRVLGMRLLQELHFAEWEFSIYFVGYSNKADIPSDPKERTRWCFQQSGAVELTHNWGTEEDETMRYHNGNDDPRGFGHIGITVPDVYEACARFEQEGVKFRKTPDGGTMKGLAFILDPDGYSIEIISANQMAKDFSKFAERSDSGSG